MPGLFIQRQAEAITPFCDVAVIYVHPDPDCPNKFEAEFSEENQVRVLRVYFRPVVSRLSLLAKLLTLLRFYKANMKAVHSIRQFDPEIVHAHVLTRMGYIGWKVSKKFKIPLVISEHWSRYFPENRSYRKGIHHQVTKFVVKKSAGLILVSAILRNAMDALGVVSPHTFIIPNVVVPEPMGHPENKIKTEKKTIIHVSCFEDKSKNITLFLKVIANLARRRQDFVCLLVGEGPDFIRMQDLARDLGILDSFVIFTGLKTGTEFYELMDRSDFLVLSSRYETFATVVVEALTCGIPVVATPVGVVPEIINESNGIILHGKDEDAMTSAIDRMLDQCRSYDKEAIMVGVENKFSKKDVGEQIVQVYRNILHPNK
jgi:glycosyltransferase involved in cell wall biosynthesis